MGVGWENPNSFNAFRMGVFRFNSEKEVDKGLDVIFGQRYLK
jgi:hypothetical protein